MNITEFRHAMNEELDRLEHYIEDRRCDPEALEYWPEDMLFDDWLTALDEYIG